MNMHYKKEYAEPLRKGVKLHTIRKRKVSVGLTLKHIVYPYHKDKRECVLENTCICTQNIEIVPGAIINDGKVYIEGRLLSLNEMQRLAWNDGFVNLVDFWMFFNEYFKGYIIHWTDLQY
jgi:hypothetical protein